jgi:Fungal specific transcription factor domain
MAHFHTHWAQIFHIPRSQTILSLSKSHPLIRSTILAIAACHLRHISPGVLAHRIAEHFQQSLALQDFQAALNTPREQLGQTGVDALMLSATLLNIVAFALPESEAETEEMSWVFSPRQDRLGWLALQAGLRPLLLSITAYRDKTLSFLGPIFFEGKKDSWEFTKMHHGLEGVPERWIAVFELDGSGLGCDVVEASYTNSSAVYRAPVTILTHLRNLEPVQSNVFKNLQFLGKIQREFRALLFERDERALWLFGYWLGLVCRYNGVWWCEKRARRDHRAVYMWLQKLHLTERPGTEGELWREMMKELELAPVFVQC